jgi:phosphonate transport system substrate-binding protein
MFVPTFFRDRLIFGFTGRLIVLLLALLSPAAFAGQAAKPLEFGVFPNLSARTVVTMYQPLRAYLEKQLGRPVNIYTAPTFKAFVERSLKREYDLMLAAPHFSRLAETDAGYIPLAVYSRELRAILVVPKGSPYKSVADLKGESVAVPDSLALMSMFAVQMLRDNGLTPGKDVFLVNVRGHDNAVLSAIHGESAAAATSAAPLGQMPDDVKNRVRVLATSDKVPHQAFMASPKLPPAEVERLRQLLLEFALTPEGRAFLETNKFGGLRPIAAGELKQLDPYAAEARKILGIR